MTQETNRYYNLYFYTSMKDRPMIVRCSDEENMKWTREEKQRLNTYTYYECFLVITYRGEKTLKTKTHKLCSEGPLQGWVW